MTPWASSCPSILHLWGEVSLHSGPQGPFSWLWQRKDQLQLLPVTVDVLLASPNLSRRQEAAVCSGLAARPAPCALQYVRLPFEISLEDLQCSLAYPTYFQLSALPSSCPASPWVEEHPYNCICPFRSWVLCTAPSCCCD